MPSPESESPRSLRHPVLALAHEVLFPHDVRTLDVTAPENLQALERLNALDGLLVVLPVRDPAADDQGRFHEVGTLARVVSRLALGKNGQRVALQGLRRVRVDSLESLEGAWWSVPERVEPLPSDEAPEEAARSRERLAALLEALTLAKPSMPPELHDMLAGLGDDDERTTDLLAARLPLTHAELVRLLAEAAPGRRMRLLLRSLESSLVRARAGNSLDRRVAERLRRKHLRAKLAELKEELNEPSPRELEGERFRQRVEASALPPAARDAALREIDLLLRASGPSSSAARQRAYLEWMLGLPWPDPSASNDDLAFEEVEERLSRSHLGLSDVKHRIAEFLAVRQLVGNARGTVLCFCGPPGTGKSSMGRAVASSLGRPLLNIPIGTIQREQELVGVPHQQPNGAPGAILAGIARIGARNPVILLDEVDKVSLGGDFHSAGALLSLLDPEQGNDFLDQYLGVPFDLSGCLFLATATEPMQIPDALFDRMETIDFPGYGEVEKFEIARTHLLKRAREYAGLRAGQLRVSPGALRAVIRSYTEEAGVRQLQRQLTSLARKAAVAVVRGEKSLNVRKADLGALLGPRTVEEELRARRPAEGVTTGLAWTSAGGSLLPIEVLAMPGTGRLILTGSLGDVLRESVQTAVSYVRTFCAHLGLDSDVLDNLDLHLHLPSAAVPKDGPSAGIAIAVAVVSRLTRCPARHDVAMTGEISLLGQVLAVGGIREKLMAAVRAGVSEVILPKRNAEECMRLDAHTRSKLRIHLIDDVREAFEIALRGRSRPRRTIVFEQSEGLRAAGGAGDEY